jgi:tellurite resistance protein TerC
MTTSVLFWIIFNAIILGVLYIDLKFVHKKAHAISIKEATFWSIFWILTALAFNIGIYFFMGEDKALKFLTGYIIEKTLSVDNLFVFLLIFEYFSVPSRYQPRVLHWGILGALVMRFILIFTGVTLLEKFHWIIYIFGGLLIYTGLKMMFEKEKKLEPEKNPALRLFKKIMPVAIRDYTDEKFFVRIHTIIHATPLFVVLILIESSDLIFAIDSIPAILAISTDPFIVYTSNVFAILGLRALYFLLSGIMPYFVYLKFGISLILCYVGVKMTLAHFYKIPTLVSLIIVMGILTTSVICSMLFPKKVEEQKP